jgi:hypothetical protein
MRRSGMSVRATSHPIGAATTQQITLAETERTSVVKSGWMNAWSVNSRRKFASVNLPDRSEKPNTTSQPIGKMTRMQSAIANSARTAAERSVRKRDASTRDTDFTP